MNRLLLPVAFAAFLASIPRAAFAAPPSADGPKPPTARQKELLEEILRLLPKHEPWERWVRATGAMPPDFDELPSVPFLPDPLRFASGREVKREDWPKRRAELLAQFQYWVTGSWPLSQRP